jgi:hypothetical protein
VYTSYSWKCGNKKRRNVNSQEPLQFLKLFPVLIRMSKQGTLSQNDIFSKTGR